MLRFTFIFFLFFWGQSCSNGSENDEDCPTKYSAGFNLKKFQQLRPGMDSNEVIHILGQPLRKMNRANSRPRDWFFERHPHYHFHWSYTDDTIVLFDPDCWIGYTVSFDSLGKLYETVRFIGS